MRYRVALLALCFAVPAAAQPADPEGATVIDAERIEGVGDIEVTASGNAEIRRDEVTIFGDLLRYNAEFGRVQGEGGVRLQRGADRFFGPRMEYSTRDDTGVFDQPNYLLQRERNARGAAEELQILAPNRSLLKDASFTTCEPGRDHRV